MRRSNVWLGVGGIVQKGNKILAVKKAYSKTQGQWTFPGGFVDADETLDEAIIREVKEETNIDAEIVGLVGARTGVLRGGVSDNLILFSLKHLSGDVKPRLGEISEARYMTYEELINDPDTTDFMKKALYSYINKKVELEKIEFMPSTDYGYINYKIFV